MSVRHESTKTSREVREVERNLTSKLKRLAERIRRDSFFPDNIGGLRQKYGAEVQATIQEAIQSTYLAGVAYVAKFEDIPSLLTSRDLQNIEEQTRFEVEGFWRIISRSVVHEQIPTTRAVSIPTAAGLIATAATIGTLALATTDKPKQLGESEQEVMFITAADERVCPICRPLHRRVFRLSDPSLPIPVKNTHPNCRCRLLFRNGRQVFSH